MTKWFLIVMNSDAPETIKYSFLNSFNSYLIPCNSYQPTSEILFNFWMWVNTFTGMEGGSFQYLMVTYSEDRVNIYDFSAYRVKIYSFTEMGKNVLGLLPQYQDIL